MYIWGPSPGEKNQKIKKTIKKTSGASFFDRFFDFLIFFDRQRLKALWLMYARRPTPP